MPQYMLLIYAPAEGGPTPEELEAQTPRWYEYTEALDEAGALVAGEALEAAAEARTLRVRSGARHISEGPAAEGGDVLGGYYVIDVPDWEAAEEWAARIPSAPYGAVEIRPILVFAEAAA
jgi:hypothetical protein